MDAQVYVVQLVLDKEDAATRFGLASQTLLECIEAEQGQASASEVVMQAVAFQKLQKAESEQVGQVLMGKPGEDVSYAAQHVACVMSLHDLRHQAYGVHLQASQPTAE
jgi:hypothetical protein